MSIITVSLSTYGSDTAGGPYFASDTVTVADTSTLLNALTNTEIDGLAANNVDIIDATDDLLTLSVAQFSQIINDGIALTAGDTVTISDTAINLAGLTFSALAGAKVDFLDATTAYTTLTAAQLTALGTVAFTAASSVTLTDIGTNIAGVAGFSTFASHGIDTLNASDDALTISMAQYTSLGTTVLTAGDTVTISDTGSNIVGGPNYSTLAAGGIDFLNATTSIGITINDITNLGVVVFTPGSTVTLTDTGAHIAAKADFSIFAAHGVDKIDASNNTLTINTVQFGGLGTVTLTAADTVTISTTATNLATLTFSALAAANVDFLNSTNAYTTLTAAQVAALGATHFTAASAVTLTDSAVNIQAVSDFTTFATHGVDTIDSTDNTLSVTAAQYAGIGTTRLTSADVVTLADTGAHIAALTSVQFGQLATVGVDTINATDDVLALSLAQFNARGAVTLTLADVVSLADTGATIGGLSTGSIDTLAAGRIDAFDATNDVLTISVAQFNQIVSDSIALTAGDTVTISDTAANLSGLTFAALASANVDFLNSTDAYTTTVAQMNALGSVAFASASAITLADTHAGIEALSAATLAGMMARGIDVVHASDSSTLNLTATQTAAVLDNGAVFAAGDSVTLLDSAANIGALTAAQFGRFLSGHVDVITATGGTLALTVADFRAIASGLLVASLTLTNTAQIGDSGVNISALTAGEIHELSDDNIDSISGTGDIDFTQAQIIALGSTAVSATGNFVLADTEANIEALSTASIDNNASLGVSQLHSTDSGNVIHFTVAQAQHIMADSIALTAADAVTISDTAANLAALNLSALAAANIDFLDATTAYATLTVAQMTALGAVHFSAASNVTLTDTAAHIEAVADLSAFAAHGVDAVDATDGALTISATQISVLGTTHLASADVVTFADSGANIGALTSIQFGLLASLGVDTIDAADDVLALSLAQFNALGPTTLTPADVVTLADTGAAIAGLSLIAIDALAAGGIDALHATNNALTLGVAQFNRIVSDSIALAGGDAVTISGTAANLAGLSFSALAAANVDSLDATTSYDTLTMAQMAALGTVHFTAASDVILTDTAADIQAGAGLSAFAAHDVDTAHSPGPFDFATFAAHGVDRIDSSDDTLSLDVAQFTSLGTTLLTGADFVTLADTAAAISGIFDALNGALVDKIIVTDSDSHRVTITLAQAASDTTALSELYQSDGVTRANVDVSDAATSAANDFNGDGHSDILWQNSDGTPAIWLMNGTSLIGGANVGFNPGPAWHEIGSGDFNGDGKSEILWQNTNGTVAEWAVNGTSLVSGGNAGFNPGASWHAIGSGDFNGDGKSDLLWQNLDGTPAVWLMDGQNILSGANVGFNPGAAWHVIGTGDFNGDGKADILWQNDSGQAAVWLMNGTSLISGANVGTNPGPSWNVQAAADFNGDGKADILWQNDSGQAAVWLMNGTILTSGADVGFNPGAAWQIHGAVDFNGDGKADILWQNDSGQAAVWLMDGLSVTSGANVGSNPGAAWHVVQQHHDLFG